MANACCACALSPARWRSLVVAMAAPASAQQPNSVNPNASAVKEQQLLDQLKTIQGRGTIPDKKSYVLEHPAGRDWRAIPQRDAEMDRRHRHPRHAGRAGHLLSVARQHEDCAPAFPGARSCASTASSASCTG